MIGIVLGQEACYPDSDSLAAPDFERPTMAEASNEPILLADVSADALMGTDKRFFEISQIVPEFGGYWIDERGDAVTALTNLTKQTAVANVTRSEIDSKLSSTGGSRRYTEVTYTFSQLIGWKENITGLFGARSDVAYLDIDQKNNRLLVGLVSVSAASAVQSLARTVGIPDGAIATTVSGRAEPDRAPPIRYEGGSAQSYHSLRHRFNRTLGGIMVRHGDTTGVDRCTLMLGVTMGSSERYVTASHCAGDDAFASLDTDLPIYQSGTNTSDRLGYELVDPQQTCSINGGGTPPARCRWADAALFGQDDSNDKFARGWIATTKDDADEIVESGGELIGSPFDAWKHNHKHGDSLYVMTSEGGEIPTTQVTGQSLIKIGAFSGRTHGRVTHDCVDIYNWPSPARDYGVRCQNLANYLRTGGDSGGPVFASDGRFFGLHVGRFTNSNSSEDDVDASPFYSPIANIEEDLGSMNTEGEEHLAFFVPYSVWQAVVADDGGDQQ
ncbi:MAG: hypothetical protein OXN85_12960 [Gemmatimonadetes bacterium]|nr:hypothetical protein [Candidatus Palauibacter australiensis]